MARHIKNSLYSQTVEGPFGYTSGDDFNDQLITERELIVPEPTDDRIRASAATTIIYLVGLSEGLTHLAALAIYYLLKDDLGLGPSQTSAILVLPALPWFLKPGLAFLSDTMPIFGYRRKPYLIAFSILEAAGYCLLATHADSLVAVATALSVVSLGAAFCSAVTEALVVETSHGTRSSPALNRSQSEADEQANRAANTNVTELLGAKAIGSLIVAYLSGALLEIYSKKKVFFATAAFPLLITIAGIFYHEEPYDNNQEEEYELLYNDEVAAPTARPTRLTPRVQLHILAEFLKQKIVWGPSLFILMFMSGPDYDDALFYFYTSKLNFSPRFMGSLRFTYGLAALIGLFVYNQYLTKSAYRSIMIWTILVNLPVYICKCMRYFNSVFCLAPLLLVTGTNEKIGISNEVFVLSGGFLIEAVAELQLLPLLVFTALICPPGLEGSVYSVMMSVRNLGAALGKMSSSLAAYLFGITSTNFSRLAQFIIVCGAFTLLPLFFTHLIPTTEQMEDVRTKNLKADRQGQRPPLISSKELWADVQKAASRTRALAGTSSEDVSQGTDH